MRLGWISLQRCSARTSGFPIHLPAIVQTLEDRILLSSSPVAAQFKTTSQTVSENVGTVTLDVQISTASDTAVSIPFTFSGTATSPADYTASATPLVIPAGATSGSITLTIVNDTVVKPTKQIIVTLGKPTTGNATLGSNVQSKIDITNSNSAFFQINGGSAVAGSPLPLTVTLTHPVAVATSLTVSTSDLTAHAGVNYTALNNYVVNFAPLQTTQTVNVTTLFDGNARPNQAFSAAPIGLNAGGQNVWLHGAPALGTIVTNPKGVPQLSINQVAASKGTAGQSKAALTVTLTQAPQAGQTVSINYATQISGTAVPNVDFVPTSGNLTFTSSGPLTQLINVSILGNTTPTANRTINVLLSSPTNSKIAVDTGVITILSNINAAPTLTSISPLGQAHEQTPFSISYLTLLGASNAQDTNGNTIQFRIMSIQNGGMTMTHNGVTSAVVAGSTLLGPDDTLTWTGNAGVTGSSVRAFTVVAFDGALNSTSAVPVQLNVDALGAAFDLSGPWTVYNASGTALGLGSMTQTGARVALTNAGSVGSTGRYATFNQLVVPSFNGPGTVTATGTVDTSTADQGRIEWRDGSGTLLAVWLRNSLAGEYSVVTPGSVRPTLASITQNGPRLTLVNGSGSTSVTITSATTLDVGVYGNGKITFSNGQVWTKLDVPQDYVSSTGGIPHLRQNGANLTFFDKFGGTSPGFWISPTEIVASADKLSDWNEPLTVGAGKLTWEDGTVWGENLVLNGIGNGNVTVTASQAQVSVIDYFNQAGKLVHLVQIGTSDVVFIDSQGAVSLGSWVNPMQATSPAYPNIIATFVLGHVMWSDGTDWTHTNTLSPVVTVVDYTNTIGATTHVVQIAGSNRLVFVDGRGRTSLGTWIDAGHTQALADLYPGDKATFSGATVTWDDGVIWTRTTTPPPLILATDARGVVSHLKLLTPTTLVGLDGPLQGLTGTRLNGQIVWSNGTVWHGFDFNALNALFGMGLS